MKFVAVSSVAMLGGVVAGTADLDAKVEALAEKFVEKRKAQTHSLLDQMRKNSAEGISSQGSATTSSLAGAAGFMIYSAAGSATCSGGLLRLGAPMGRCMSESSSDSYYFSCNSNATHVVGSMTYCSDTTCTNCNAAMDYVVYPKSQCTAGGFLWNYDAGVTCTSDTAPYESYDDSVISLQYDSAADCASAGDDDVVSFVSTPLNECLSYGNMKATSCSGGTVAYTMYEEASCSTKIRSVSLSLATCELDEDDDDDDVDDDVDDDNDPTYTTAMCGGSGGDDDDCFHVDSTIDYKGVKYSYEELKAGKEPECSVPHSPYSRGVIVSTTCGKTARVTDTHLMATTKGFQLAYSLKAGDVLFGDYHQELCTVTSVEKEQTTQQYFGLNCVHSEVLTSGLRASTFGDFHTLPSWYMTYVGGLVGTDVASTLGGYIAEWYFQK